MKKQFLLTRMLLLCALIIGSVSSAWGDSNVSTVSTKFSQTGTVTTNFTQTGDFTNAAWSLDVTWKTSGSTYWGDLNSTKGSQIGSGSKPASQVVLTGTGIAGTITSVKVNTSMASGGSITLGVSVGGNEFKCDSKATANLSTTSTDYDFVGSASGNIVITWNQASTSKAIYIKSITTTFSSGEKTTTTINSSAITNTDVYVSTAAGSLSATVKKSDDSAVPDPVVTWSSNNEDVATINESTGEITLVAPGEVTFTATYAGDENYAGSSNTYDMTVTSSAPDQLFFLVTDVNDLAAGDKIIIVSGTNAMSTTQEKNNRGETAITKKTDGSIPVSVGDDVQILTLEGTTDAWYLNTGKGYLYAASSSSNHLKTEEEKDDNAKAVITFSGDDASIEFQGSNTRNSLKYNKTSSLFSCYASTSDMAAVQIYKYKATATVSINSDCTDGEKYYGTYSNSSAFIVPADLTVSAISVAGNKLTVTAYETGDVVKANTGVMVSSTTAGDHTIVLSNETGSEIAGNMLKASSVAMDGDNLFYRLTMHNDTDLGFYWGAADGAAFSIAANKAYLAVPKATAARIAGFNLFEEEGEATAIEGVKTIGTDAAVFNLNGQRVNGNAKGLLIKNGKKFMNR